MKTIDHYVGLYTEALAKNPNNTIHANLAPVIAQAVQDTTADLRTQLEAAQAALDIAEKAIRLVTKGIDQRYLKDWLLVRDGATHLLSEELDAALASIKKLKGAK
jgi:alkylation response protein AidB-like acyl-CoA dehydrogenase